MEVELAYGQDGLRVEVPDEAVVVRPRPAAALPDSEGAVRSALRKPLAGPPLASLVRRGARVAVVFPDITRPMPNRTVLPPLLAELEAAGVRPRDIELISATGSHRPATEDELGELVGDEILGRYAVRNHVATDGDHVQVGEVDGAPVLIDRGYTAADVKIVTGFVEPHFFAGFSGGPKAVCPGLAALETILEAHSPPRIASEHATWLLLEGNPVHDFVRAATALAPPAFSVDVVIDDSRRLLAAFAGELGAVHHAACRHVRETVVQEVPGRFEVVLSTNGGYPLDRNLYQAVKGMAAAERVVVDGGSIVLAAECRDGLPQEGDFAGLVESATGPDELVDPQRPRQLDRWQVQVLGRVLRRADVGLYSGGLSESQIEQAHLRPVADPGQAVEAALAEGPPGSRLCVLPFGPLTVAEPT
jgi:nickel-dependent lactate racemase